MVEKWGEGTSVKNPITLTKREGGSKKARANPVFLTQYIQDKSHFEEGYRKSLDKN